MIKVKDTPKRTSIGKRNITVEDVHIEGDYLCDDNGNIATGIAEALPDNVEEFTIKISVEMPDEEDE